VFCFVLLRQLPPVPTTRPRPKRLPQFGVGLAGLLGEFLI
jgi:hypothetical protein